MGLGYLIFLYDPYVVDRSQPLFFSRKSALLDLFLPKLFGQVEALETHRRKPVPSFIDANVEVSVRWHPPPLGTFKLNSDGSYHQGLAACGGLISDDHGRFIKGFHCNLGVASPVHA